LDHDGPVVAVAFAADGSWVATGSQDGSARVFEANSDLLLARVLATMTRPLNTSELRRYSLARNCRHVEQWDRWRASATALPAPQETTPRPNDSE
jgi:WD40 repeat protein